MLEVEIQPGATIQDVLTEVTQRYPILNKHIWAERGGLSELVHVFINGENINHLQGLATKLTAGDKVDIFPPLVGGSVDY